MPNYSVERFENLENPVLEACSFRLRAYEGGSILDLFSFGSVPYRTFVDVTDIDPIQRSVDVKKDFLLRK